MLTGVPVAETEEGGRKEEEGDGNCVAVMGRGGRGEEEGDGDCV
jgi:hypothetical protein